MGDSKIPLANSGSKNEIPQHRDRSPPQDTPTHQISTSSTVKIITSDLLQIADDTEVAGDGVLTVQNEKHHLHFANIDEENTLKAPIAHGCQLIASIL